MPAQKPHSKFETLTSDNFIKNCQASARQYENDVLSHDVLTNEFIKLAVQRGIDDKQRTDLYFDQEAVDRVYQFFSYLRIPIKNRPRQFRLSPFQAWIIQELFGYFYTADDSRRFNVAYLFTARKSGKSMFAAAIALYMFTFDREHSPEIYFAATTRDQASQLLDYCKSIVIDSPVLRKRVRVLQYALRTKIRGIGKLKTVQSKASRLDGLNPHCAVVDEYHAHPDDSLFNIFKTGMVQRENPLLIITSTAGVDKEGPFFKEVEDGKKVLRGEVTNDRYFYALYTLDNEREIETPEAWIKANPNIGVTVKLSVLIADFEAAKLSATKMHNFIIKNLNVFQDALIDQWIPDSIYKTCFVNPNLWELRGEFIPGEGRKKLNAYLGLDMSHNKDLASLVCVVENPKTEKLEVFAEFYFPQNEQKRIRGGALDLRDWIKQKHIFEMETPIIDDRFIGDRLEKFAKVFNIVYIGYDKYNANSVIARASMKGINPVHAPQTAMFFNKPLKYIEKLMYIKKINMSRNPALRWNFNNVVLYQDGNANIKIMKNKSKDSVDGAVALGMAIGVYLKDNEGRELMELYLKTA